jgi:Domain of unknown function (DUF4333)
MSDPSYRLALLIPLVALALGHAACGDATVSKSEIEDKATSALAKQVGQTPKSINCPDDLDAKAGAQETCTLTANDGTTIDMTATVKSVDGDRTELTFQVAEHANN